MSTDARPTVRSLLEGLNPPQEKAVLHTHGPLLILAGPGSGKTRVVTRRVAYLAQTVTKPRHILAITFTNKAAKEMRERIGALNVAPGATVCTFHALCAKLLRMYADRAGISRNFTIVDRDDRRKLVKQAIEACGLSTSNYSPAAAEHVIGQAKNKMLTAAGFASISDDWREQTYARVYEAYERLLETMSSMDFDDLLMRVARLLQTDEALRGELEDWFRYVLIDEYQDTNAAQYQIARMLTKKSQNLCATGDPDQSIYGWRGAEIGNILSFEQDNPGALVVRLEQNYRSTKRILSAADVLIGANQRRKQKALWTENDDGSAVRVVEWEDASEEALHVARSVVERIRAGTPAHEIAVFYRINSLSRTLEEAFLREGVPYQIARGVEFYSRKEVKDVLAYLRVLINPADEVALLRIINTPPRGIGDTTVDRLVEIAKQSGRRVYDVVTGTDDLTIPGRAAAKVRDFGQMLIRLVGLLQRPAAEAVGAIITQSGLRALYHDERGLDEVASENLDELISAAKSYENDYPGTTIVDWLEHTALVSDVDSVQEGGGPVTLMTLHAAKGLEFAVVYMIGMEDGLLPFRRHDDNDVDEEEERRLCFVGMTRAKEHLTLSRARYRMLRGMTQRTIRSPFLDELRDGGIEWDEADPIEQEGRRGRRPEEDAGRLPEDIEEWQVGTLVEHPSHGIGQIMAMHRGAKRTHVDVLFRDGSRRSWVLEFAELKRVDYHDVG